MEQSTFESNQTYGSQSAPPPISTQPLIAQSPQFIKQKSASFPIFLIAILCFLAGVG